MLAGVMFYSIISDPYLLMNDIAGESRSARLVSFCGEARATGTRYALPRAIQEKREHSHTQYCRSRPYKAICRVHICLDGPEADQYALRAGSVQAQSMLYQAKTSVLITYWKSC